MLLSVFCLGTLLKLKTDSRSICRWMWSFFHFA